MYRSLLNIITKEGKESVVLNSNICFFAYKIDMQDLDKAYEIYIKQYKNTELIGYLPKKAPKDRKEKDKIHVRIVFNGVDYNILFEKKEDNKIIKGFLTIDDFGNTRYY